MDGNEINDDINSNEEEKLEQDIEERDEKSKLDFERLASYQNTFDPVPDSKYYLKTLEEVRILR